MNFFWVQSHRSFAESCAHLLTWNFTRILQFFDKAIGLISPLGTCECQYSYDQGDSKIVGVGNRLGF